jgi:hypothetical protein
MIYVIRDGKLVPKQDAVHSPSGPYISRMEPYRSPIDGKEITSWGARNRDLKENDAVDPRDLPKSGRKNQDNGRPDPEPELPFWR